MQTPFPHCCKPCSNWEEGVFSKVDLRFEEPDRGNTRVTLKQVRAGAGVSGGWGRLLVCGCEGWGG